MKSFKEYLQEADNLKWNLDVPSTNSFESDKDNQLKAQSVLRQALKEKGTDSGLGGALDLTLRKKAAGEPINDKGEEIQDIQKALFVLSHMANTKNLSSGIETAEARKLANELSYDDFKKMKEDKIVKLGKELAIKSRKNTRNEKDNDTTDKPNTDNTDNDTTDEPNTDNTDNDTTDEPNTDNTENDTTDDTTDTSDEPKTKKTGTNKDKDVDLESDNERSPNYIYSQASQKITDLVAKLKDEVAKVPENKKTASEKVAKKFERRANKQLHKIQSKQNGFSVFPTSTSRINATRDALKAKNEINRLISSTEYNLIKARRQNSFERGAQQVGEFAQGVARKFDNIKNSKAVQVAGQATKKAVQVAGQATKKVMQKAGETAKRTYDKGKEYVQSGKAKEKLSNTANIIKNKISNTVNNLEAKRKAKFASKKVMDKATKDKIVPGTKKQLTPEEEAKIKEEEAKRKAK